MQWTKAWPMKVGENGKANKSNQCIDCLLCLFTNISPGLNTCASSEIRLCVVIKDPTTRSKCYLLDSLWKGRTHKSKWSATLFPWYNEFDNFFRSTVICCSFSLKCMPLIVLYWNKFSKWKIILDKWYPIQWSAYIRLETQWMPSLCQPSQCVRENR